MDVTDAQFGHYGAFFEASLIPGADQPVLSEGQWTYHNSLIPSALPAPDHGFTNPVPPGPRFFHPYDPQHHMLSDGFPSVAESNVGHLEFRDLVAIDWDVYLMSLDLTADASDITQPSAHLANQSHDFTTQNQESQQSRSVFGLPFSFLTGYGSLPAVSPVPQNDTARDSTISTRTDNSENTVPPDTDYTSKTQLWPYMDVRNNGISVCLWTDDRGKVCGYESSTDLVKRHLRGVHFGLKPFKCTMCGHQFRTNFALEIHINVHLGYKPYKCSQCESCFSSPSARSSHRKSSHPPDEAET